MQDQKPDFYCIRYTFETGDINALRTAIDANPMVLKENDRRDGSLVGEAVDACDFASLVLFLSRGANPNGVGDCDSPLCRAVTIDNCDESIQFIGLLIAAGADLERHGMRGTPLHEAVHMENKRKVEFLLSMGANINARTQADGHTPLWLATFYHNIEMVRLLVQHGADVEIADTTIGEKPFDLAQKAEQETRDALVQAFALP